MAHRERLIEPINAGIDEIIASLFPPHPVSAWDTGGVRLIKDDSTNPGVFKPKSVDLIITSPPYNVGKEYTGRGADDSVDYSNYLRFSRKWLKNCYEWARPTGRLCVNVSIDKNKNGKTPLAADITALAMEAGWNYHATIVWNEGNISRRTAWGSWMSASAPHIIAPVEVVIVLFKNEWKLNRKGKSDITADEFKEWVFGVWDFNGESGKRVGHPAPFPRELPRRCIKLFSYPGDTVLDPFAGSGTTMIEAILNKRVAVGIEREDEYCKLIASRIKAECGLPLNKSSQEQQASSIDDYCPSRHNPNPRKRVCALRLG